MSLCNICDDDCSDGVCKALPRIKRHVQEFLMREELSGRLEYEEVNKNEEEPDSDRHG